MFWISAWVQFFRWLWWLLSQSIPQRVQASSHLSHRKSFHCVWGVSSNYKDGLARTVPQLRGACLGLYPNCHILPRVPSQTSPSAFLSSNKVNVEKGKGRKSHASACLRSWQWPWLVFSICKEVEFSRMLWKKGLFPQEEQFAVWVKLESRSTVCFNLVALFSMWNGLKLILHFNKLPLIEILVTYLKLAHSMWFGRWGGRSTHVSQFSGHVES